MDRCGAGAGRFGGGKGVQDGGVSSRFASITIATASLGVRLASSSVYAGQPLRRRMSASRNLARILLPQSVRD